MYNVKIIKVIYYYWYDQNWFVCTYEWGFPGGSHGKESACNIGDAGSVPVLERSPVEGNGNSSILAWRIPWTEEPGGLQFMELQRVGHDRVTNTHKGLYVSEWPNLFIRNI